jgi:FixJ family two-component response regulator
MGGRSVASSADELSTREQQVLRLVTKGLANKQIARYLGISESTVKAKPSSNGCAAPHAIQVAVLYCCTREPGCSNFAFDLWS